MLRWSLVDAVADIATSEEWARMLAAAARFHDYSPSNILLICAQRPGANPGRLDVSSLLHDGPDGVRHRGRSFPDTDDSSVLGSDHRVGPNRLFTSRGCTYAAETPRRAALVALVFVGFSTLASPASAAESWTTQLSCGVNYVCRVNSNTTSGYVNHYVSGVPTGSWLSGGAHSSSRNVNVSSAWAKVDTGGTFNSHSASCSCRPGVVCGV